MNDWRYAFKVKMTDQASIRVKAAIDALFTCVIGGLGGPGAMKATVEAVALLATTDSVTLSSTLLMFLRLRTVQIP